MKKLAFVIPWYGEDISGGAEAELRGLVHHLQDAGVELEVLSTCVKDFRSDWSVDYHKPGLENCAGISVRRFPVRKRDTAGFDTVNAKFMFGQPVNAEEEAFFMREMVNSPELYRYIREHKAEYELFVFIPYMFGTTYFGVQECMEKAILIPCLHDEAYAYMHVFRDCFSKVAGMTFLSDPERMLAEKLYGVSGETFTFLGAGVDTDFSINPNRFRDKYNLNEPFVLYAGRKDAGKRVDELIWYFVEFKRRNPSDLKLVLIGGGEIEIPSEDILDLGFVPAQDKYDAYAAATVFCNPSEMESFSIVIMESWLAETPVLVNGKCAVTTDFAKMTNGGLYYSSYAEFEGCLRYLLTNPAATRQMGKNGREYVLANFAWDAIVEKYSRYFEMMGKRCNGQENEAQLIDISSNTGENEKPVVAEPLTITFGDSSNIQDLIAALLLFADFQRRYSKPCRLSITLCDDKTRDLANVLCRELMISDSVSFHASEDNADMESDICLIPFVNGTLKADSLVINRTNREFVKLYSYDHDKSLQSLNQVVAELEAEEV